MKLLKNKKRLNNKGFTLIELLAVVVILAVVMGIAMTSVLSSMNNSRKGSLQNSAKSVAQAFQNKYSEAMITGQTSAVYGDVLGSATNNYNFNVATESSPKFYYLTDGLKDELNLAPSTYRLTSGISEVTMTTVGEGEDAKTTAYAKDSFVAFNGKTVVVCLFANQEGSYYVAEFAKNNGNTEIFGVDVHFNSDYNNTVGNAIDMWACSQDDVYSWTKDK